MKDLPRRALAAVVAIPLLAWVLFMPSPVPFGILVAAASIAGLREVLTMFRRLGFTPLPGPAYGAVVALHAAAIFEWQVSGAASLLVTPLFLVTLTVLTVLVLMLIGGMDRDNFPDVSVTLFSILYAGLLATFITRLRVLSEGAQWVFLLFAVTWTYDTGAYFWGISVGGPKLWPSVSPKKTWAGLWGGIGTTVVLLAALRMLTASGTPHLLPVPLTLNALLWLVPVACVMAQLGDLAESMLKRAAGVKDSGKFLPGHGGLLDKLDSFLFTGPLLYFLAVAVL